MNARVFALCLLSTVAFANPSGRRWQLESCTSSCTTNGDPAPNKTCASGRCQPNFRIATSVGNTGGTTINGGVAWSSIKTIIKNAFPRWTAAACDNGTTTYRVSYLEEFTTPQEHSAANAGDNLNNVIWVHSANWTHGAGELALTTTTYFLTDSFIIDADMELNDSYPWSTNAAANTYDIESVVLHEAGHFAGIDHSAAGSAVMYAYYATADQKQQLTDVDVDDICTVYPPVGGTIGTPCSADSECGDPNYTMCRARSGAVAKICTRLCPTTCPTGYACDNTSAGGQACLPQIGAPDQCKFCLNASQCSTGQCLRFNNSTTTFCSTTCQGTLDCPTNYSCDNGYCVPNAGTCTNQCTTNANCAAGYNCTNGTCVFRGAAGDDCTAARSCSDCNQCVFNTAGTQATCRTCCAGNGQGGACSTCQNATCASGLTCQALTDSPNSSVCQPGTAAPTSCQPCGADNSCAQGLVCLAGTCRAACNPAAPGVSCAACYAYNDGTNTSGACACPGELKAEGEACGQLSPSQLAACNPGLTCVNSGSGNLCRQLCDPLVPSSCGAGKTCFLVGGQGVCLPGTYGNQCSACTNTGSCNGTLQCFAGGCYPPCNVFNTNQCATCVQTNDNGAGVCACPEQVSERGGTCGTQPTLAACKSGLTCKNGLCTVQCDPSNPSACNPNEFCDEDNGNYCFPAPLPSGGGSGSTDAGTDAGVKGGGSGQHFGNNDNVGCGCSEAGGQWSALLFGVLMLTRRVQRRSNT